jgi:hypothetical protein
MIFTVALLAFRNQVRIFIAICFAEHAPWFYCTANEEVCVTCAPMITTRIRVHFGISAELMVHNNERLIDHFLPRLVTRHGGKIFNEAPEGSIKTRAAFINRKLLPFWSQSTAAVELVDRGYRIGPFPAVSSLFSTTLLERFDISSIQLEKR